MKRLQRDAVLLELINALEANESWCGETHVQKATYLLQEVTGAPLGFEFMLYKYGPYSFDLNDELAALQADRMIRLKVRDPRYGASIVTTEHSPNVIRRFPRTVREHEDAVRFIAQSIHTKGVAELEREATALLVTRRLGPDSSVEERAVKLREIKPHVEHGDAVEAVRFVDRLAREWRERAGADAPAAQAS